MAESNGRLLLGIWRDSLHVTCGLTACTPGSAPGPTLGNEYGKTLPFFTLSFPILNASVVSQTRYTALCKCPVYFLSQSQTQKKPTFRLFFISVTFLRF